eukprot:2157349-Pyramimonas_sp.AAC.1
MAASSAGNSAQSSRTTASCVAARSALVNWSCKPPALHGAHASLGAGPVQAQDAAVIRAVAQRSLDVLRSTARHCAAEAQAAHPG